MLALISDENIKFDIDRIYPKNIRNSINLLKAFDFNITKLEIKGLDENLSIDILSLKYHI